MPDFMLPENLEADLQERKRKALASREVSIGKYGRWQEKQAHGTAAQKGLTYGSGIENRAIRDVRSDTLRQLYQAESEEESKAGAERLGWAKSERGFQQQQELQRGSQEFQATQNDLNRQLQDTLAREGWSQEAQRLQSQLDSNKEKWEAEIGSTENLAEMEDARVRELTEMGYSLEEAKIQAQKDMQEKGLAHETGMQATEIEQQQWLQEKQAELVREGMDEESARQQAALEWEREKEAGRDVRVEAGRPQAGPGYHG